MDISVASNFERLLYNLYDDDSTVLAQNMRSFPKKSIDIPESKQEYVADFFKSFRSDDQEILEQIRTTYQENKYLLDPHTATGVRASNALSNAYDPIITMGTAHPAKFADAIEKAVPELTSTLPKKVEKAFDREEVLSILPENYDEIKEFILKRAL